MTITLTTESPTTGQQYRLTNARNVEWFSSYGADGAGFGYLTFKLFRRGGRDYPDIGHGYIVEVTKGPWRTLFHGQIVKITEERGERDSLAVWCLGFVHLLSSDVYNRVYCDTRLSAWQADENPDLASAFRPDLFEWQVDEVAGGSTSLAQIYNELSYSVDLDLLCEEGQYNLYGNGVLIRSGFDGTDVAFVAIGCNAYSSSQNVPTTVIDYFRFARNAVIP